MFERLFAESGLSLDRLRVLVEVGATGSIVRAAESDPVRQSQYSRQLKELEDFFQATLAERQGRGVRLTAAGRELARISRFFLLGLANFQRGCISGQQTYRIGADATFIASFLLPALAKIRRKSPSVRLVLETVTATDAERRLHELTLDFCIVTQSELSRPLQLRALRRWRLQLWVPKALFASERQASRAFAERRLLLAWPGTEIPQQAFRFPANHEPAMVCNNFLEARAAVGGQALATFLPEFLEPGGRSDLFLRIELPELSGLSFCYSLAWNPRLLRLNVHASRYRDALIGALSGELC